MRTYIKRFAQRASIQAVMFCAALVLSPSCTRTNANQGVASQDGVWREGGSRVADKCEFELTKAAKWYAAEDKRWWAGVTVELKNTDTEAKRNCSFELQLVNGRGEVLARSVESQELQPGASSCGYETVYDTISLGDVGVKIAPRGGDGVASALLGSSAFDVAAAKVGDSATFHQTLVCRDGSRMLW